MMDLWNRVKESAMETNPTPKWILCFRTFMFMIPVIIKASKLYDSLWLFGLWCVSLVAAIGLYWCAFGCSTNTRLRVYFQVLYCTYTNFLLIAWGITEEIWLYSISGFVGIISKGVLFLIVYFEHIVNYAKWKRRLDRNDLYYSEELTTTLNGTERRTTKISVLEWIFYGCIVVEVVWYLLFERSVIGVIDYLCIPTLIVLNTCWCDPEWVFLKYRSIKTT